MKCTWRMYSTLLPKMNWLKPTYYLHNYSQRFSYLSANKFMPLLWPKVVYTCYQNCFVYCTWFKSGLFCHIPNREVELMHQSMHRLFKLIQQTGTGVNTPASQSNIPVGIQLYKLYSEWCMDTGVWALFRRVEIYVVNLQPRSTLIKL